MILLVPEKVMHYYLTCFGIAMVSKEHEICSGYVLRKVSFFANNRFLFKSYSSFEKSLDVSPNSYSKQHEYSA